MTYINLTRDALEPMIVPIADGHPAVEFAFATDNPHTPDPLAPHKVVGLQLTSELFLALEEYQARELLDVLHEALAFTDAPPSDDDDDHGDEWKNQPH